MNPIQRWRRRRALQRIARRMGVPRSVRRSRANWHWSAAAPFQEEP